MSDLQSDVLEITHWSWDEYKRTPSWVVEKLVARHNQKAREAEAQAEAKRSAARSRH